MTTCSVKIGPNIPFIRSERRISYNTKLTEIRQEIDTYFFLSRSYPYSLIPIKKWIPLQYMHTFVHAFLHMHLITENSHFNITFLLKHSQKPYNSDRFSLRQLLSLF